AGLEATYEAVKAGKTVGLANKECLVAAGELITAEARRQSKPLLPIDSEHNAVHQCLRGGRMEEVQRIWLTASGGPFLHTPKRQFSAITVQEALNHPTWKMGRRITIDSATLMNKGFEVIEACRLFNLPADKVEVIVHPQSTIHSMVEFVDGSILAQFSITDMRLPILYALTYPERIASDLRFPVMDLRHLDFCPPDMDKFPCLRLAYEAAEAGGAQPIALHAADEVAVAAFLEGQIGFDQIPVIIQSVMAETPKQKLESIKDVLRADVTAREAAGKHVETLRSQMPLPQATSIRSQGEYSPYMEQFFISVLAMAAVLGFMILIHEFGHYAAAKFFGVRVEVFSIGFGTRLLGFRKGETDYRISAIPLGGYVKMSGENPMDERTGDPKEFLSHPRWQRFVIAFAGPAMNILLAIVLLMVVYMVHYEYPVYLDKPAVVAWVKQDSPAAKAGLQPGDRIVRVDGIQNPTWEQLEPKIELSPNLPVEIAVERDGRVLDKTIVPKAVTLSQIGSAGWEPQQSIVVANLEADMPAAKAGIKEGDRIVSVNGQPLPSISALIEKLQQTKEAAVDIGVVRDGSNLNFHVAPVLAAAE